MSNPEIPQATWARHLNKMGATVGAGALVTFDMSQLMRTAFDNTGLHDFGDRGFQNRLELLLRSLDQEADLTFLGRILAVCDILRVLESRLRLIDAEKRFPRIASEQIREPVFVLGMARTGTTFLHELLAQDPANRAPLVWEMFDPAPPVSESNTVVERIAVADAFMTLWPEIDPSYLSKHESRGDLTSECCLMMLLEFYGTYMLGSHDVPAYVAMLGNSDPLPALAMHKRVLQMLQWGKGTRRWVLKDPSHLGYLPSLLSMYPDARIVHTHRDPAQVIPSTTSLLASSRLMRSDRFDGRGTTQMMTIGQAASLEKVIAERESGLIPASQIADVFFEKLMAEPVAQVEMLYEHWGLEFTNAARNAMHAYVAARPRDKFGEHGYAYSGSFDLDEEAQRFSRYAEYYGITIGSGKRGSGA